MAIINTIASVAGPGVTTVYTCPAGISHAVVHVYLYNSNGSAGATAKLNNTANNGVGGFLYAAASTTAPAPNSSASMFLKPGDTIALQATSVSSVDTLSLTVTGYEVP